MVPNNTMRAAIRYNDNASENSVQDLCIKELLINMTFCFNILALFVKIPMNIRVPESFEHRETGMPRNFLSCVVSAGRQTNQRFVTLEISAISCWTRTCEKKSEMPNIWSLTYESILGILRVGIVVTIWPHSSVPIPKNRHHIHCSRVRAAVLNAILPYWIMTTLSKRMKSRINIVIHVHYPALYCEKRENWREILADINVKMLTISTSRIVDDVLTCDKQVPIQIE